METSVNLQDPFSYSMWPIVLVEVILISLTFTIIILVINGKKKREVKKIEPKQPLNVDAKKSKTDVKGTYLRKIEAIEMKYRSGELSKRACYQELSGCVREFVYMVTGVNVTTCTLMDIQGLKMPNLEMLITNYYHPEFAKNTEYEVEQAIMEAKRVVNTWN